MDQTWTPTFDNNDAWDMHRWARAAVEAPADELQRTVALGCAFRAAMLTEFDEPKIVETLALALASVGLTRLAEVADYTASVLFQLAEEQRQEV